MTTGGARTVAARILSSQGVVGPAGPAGVDATIASVATLAALTALSVTGLVTGSIAHVTTLRGYFKLDKASVLTPDGITIVAAAVGNWLRIKEVADPFWLATYLSGGAFVDTAGNDENTGTASGAGSALKTFAEWRRRVGFDNISFPIGSVLTVTVAAGTYAEIVDLRGIAGAVHILGTETVVTSGTLTSSTAISRAANTHQQIGTAAFDFTTHIKKHVVLTSGASSGARAVVESIPSANNAQTSGFYTQASLTVPTIVTVTPGATDTFDIRVPGTVIRDFRYEPGVRLVVGGAVVVNNPFFTSIQLNPVGTTRITGIAQWNMCKHDVKGSGGAQTLQLDGDGQQTFIGCVLGFVTANGAQTAAEFACGVFGPQVAGFTGAIFLFDFDTLFSNSTAFPNTGQLQLGKVGFANTSASKHMVDGSGVPSGGYVRFVSGAAIYGTATGATADAFKLGRFSRVEAGSVVPTATFTGVAARFPGGTTRTFAQLTGASYTDAANLASWQN